MHEAAYCEVYPVAKRAAQVYAAAAVVAGALPAADRADLEQEALLAFWRALPKFDPTRASLRTFSERVIANRIASTARAQRAVRRTPVLTEAPSCSEHPGFTIELRVDVDRALAVLRDDDRRLARLLVDHSPTEASRSLHISRSTVYERIRRMRIAFEDVGFGPRGGRP
jgi:RNA polymerase sigma-70 factor (ECF subfamily)